MKKLLVVFFVLLVSNSYSQKSNVRAAYNYLKYDQLDKGKGVIDEAIANEQTKNSDMAWYYRGLIYESMYKHKTFGNLDSNPIKVAYDSYQKSLELAPKGEFVEEIKSRMKILSVTFLAKGIDEFNAKNYSGALESFETTLKISPDDTTAIFNAGLTADKLNNFTKSAGYYSRLIDMKLYEARKFLLLSNALKAKGDSAKSLETIISGRKIFPDDYPLLLQQINFYLPMGKNKEATDLLKEAIAKDQKNESLYFALGNTYDNLRIASANKAASDDYFSLAEIAYKKAIELKPDYGDAYFNIGIMHFSRGEEMDNAANRLKAQAEYDKAKAQSHEVFGIAKQYLEKAQELNPKDVNVLTTLKQLYIRTGETEKYNAIQKTLDGLK